MFFNCLDGKSFFFVPVNVFVPLIEYFRGKWVKTAWLNPFLVVRVPKEHPCPLRFIADYDLGLVRTYDIAFRVFYVKTCFPRPLVNGYDTIFSPRTNDLMSDIVLIGYIDYPF